MKLRAVSESLTFNGQRLTVIHSCETPEALNHLVCRGATEPYVTLLEHNSELVVVPRPMHWDTVSTLPLACEVHPGDTLPGPVYIPDCVQLVTRVVEQFDHELRITTVDTSSRRQVRQWLFSPLEEVDMTRERVRRRKPGTIAGEETWPDGPYVNKFGAVYVYMRRPTRGGRPPARLARATFMEMPLKDPDTDEIIPYFVAPPTRAESQQELPTKVTPGVFTATARRHPLVQEVVRRHGRDA